jgi:hypothetical protein
MENNQNWQPQGQLPTPNYNQFPAFWPNMNYNQIPAFWPTANYNQIPAFLPTTTTASAQPHGNWFQHQLQAPMMPGKFL